MKQNKIIPLLHQMPAHTRLLIGLGVALITYLIIRNAAHPPFPFIFVWISFSFTILLMLWLIIATAEPDEIRVIAKKQDSGRTITYLFVVAASFGSLLAIIQLMRIKTGDSIDYYHILFSVISVIFSWVLIHTIFTYRYAHLYYSCESEEKDIEKDKEGGLQFPNDEDPDYLDFAYFSFVIGMTFQVSDVQITSSYMRRLVLLHGLLAFAFNTAILALSINIVSSLIKK